MSRPTVPHCRSCSFLFSYPRSFCLWAFARSSWYYCTHLQYGGERRPVSGQEVRTCPKWCPLRASHRRYQSLGVIK